MIGNIGFGLGVLSLFLFFVVSGIFVLVMGIELITNKSIGIMWTLLHIIYFLGLAGLILLVLFSWSELGQTFIQTGVKG